MVIPRVKRWGSRIRDYILRTHDSIFLVLLLTPPFVVYGVTAVQTVSLYQIVILSVSAYQAIITAYLSFKIFVIGKRDSELPDLSLEIVDVQETPGSSDDYLCYTCTVRITNSSHGRAKISKVDTSDETLLPDATGRTPSVGFPARGLDLPIILDKGESEYFLLQINGFSQLDGFDLVLHEVVLGEQEFTPTMSDISAMLKFKEAAEERA